MNDKIERLNGASRDDAMELFIDCCGSLKWALTMAESRPFENFAEIAAKAEVIWSGLDARDWRESFAAHPRIGSHESSPSQNERAAVWSRHEQSGMAEASDSTLVEFGEINRLYERTFGYIFIVCATGKSEDEMRELIWERLKNDPDTELKIAAAEQNKITRIRLEKLFS